MRQSANILAAAVFSVSTFAVQAHAQQWGCYDPQPGHPTQDEKRAFIDRIVPLARLAERQHGVPAAAIAAMSAVESGFGFTQVAQNAKNYFGWKFVSASAAGGRAAWTLECQPASDPNNKYIVFASEADGIDFVASRLARSPYYRDDTARYGDDLRRGVDPVVATRRWVAGVADPYNWRPDLYARTITRVMNAPLAPSDTVSPDSNLYALANAASSDALALTKAALAGFVFGRYMEQNCATTTLPGWEGFPVGLCRYGASGGATAQVALLDPTDQQLHRWIASACAKIRASDIGICARNLAKRIRSQSGAQFPVAGMVLEDMDGNGVMNQFAFRDGVTVTVEGVQNAVERAPSAAENEAALRAPPTAAKLYARIAGTTRAQYAAFVGRPASDFAGLKWLDETRAAYQRAWGQESNELITAWAVANKAALGGR